jgi:hypothetical protein
VVLAINMHFCCGQLVDWAVNSEAQRCGEPAIRKQGRLLKELLQGRSFFYVAGRVQASVSEGKFFLSPGLRSGATISA